MSDLIANRFELLDELGAGGSGRVWRALDTVLRREVALKEVAAIGGALTEARAAARLNHRSIVTVHDVIDDGDRVLIAMELLDGPTLAEVVAAAGAQPAATVRAVMGQVADALSAAHALGVVHGDVKPANVFWLTSGRVVVADFGIAHDVDTVTTRAVSGMGSPAYLSPELVRGDTVAPPADIFAWGVVTAELLAGRHPFGAAPETAPATLLYRIAHEAHAPVRTDDLPLGDVVTWSLEKDPRDRPRDGSELLQALSGAISPAVLSAGGRPGTRRATRPYDPQRRTRIVTTVALCAVAAAAVVGLVSLVASGGLGGPVSSAAPNPATKTTPTTAGGPVTTVVAFFRVGDVGAAVRERPRSSSSEIATVAGGSLLPADGQRATDGAGAEWVRVKETKNGSWGWVKAAEGSPADDGDDVDDRPQASQAA